MLGTGSYPTWGVLLVGILGGCASSHPGSWEDGATLGRAPGLGGPIAARATTPTRRAAEHPQIESASEPIEVQLLRFSARRRALIQARERQGGVWPAEVVVLFQDLFDALLVSLDPVAEARLSRRALIQARVVPEAELEMTVTRFGAPPKELATALSRVQVAVTWHMRELALRERGVETNSPLHGVTMAWPLQPVLLTSAFGYRRDPMHDEIRFHSGVDLGGQKGELVFAASPGVVMEAGWSGAYGRRVVIQHAEGLATVYAHLDGLLVVEGVRVELGSPLGFLGSSGRSTGPHLHFEVRQFGEAVDPLDVVGRTVMRPRMAQAD